MRQVPKSKRSSTKSSVTMKRIHIERFQKQDFATLLNNEQHLSTQTLLFVTSLGYVSWSVLDVTWHPKSSYYLIANVQCSLISTLKFWPNCKLTCPCCWWNMVPWQTRGMGQWGHPRSFNKFADLSPGHLGWLAQQNCSRSTGSSPGSHLSGLPVE